ncbi:MAG TPA: hypothetical protein VGO47_11095 [Chlamydiales bacterium]|nr:hypothetical protein [Chlamydiales bacterium]
MQRSSEEERGKHEARQDEERMRQNFQNFGYANTYTFGSSPAIDTYPSHLIGPPLPITRSLQDIPEREHEEVSGPRPPPRPHRRPPIPPGSTSELDQPDTS